MNWPVLCDASIMKTRKLLKQYYNYLLPMELILIVIFCIFMILFFFDPSAYGFYPPCIFRSLTGYYCPGCGSGQALYHLMHGELPKAFYYNPLAVLLLPPCLLAVIIQVVQRRGWKISLPELPAGAVVILLLIVLSFWLVRNMAFYPLFPAPMMP